MQGSDVRSWHLLVFLAAFWAMWIWAGHNERARHEVFFSEVGDFIHKGDRFTADDGRALKARVEALEKQLEATDGDVRPDK